jgi:DNA primase
VPRQGGVIWRIKATRSTFDEMCAAGISLRPAGTNSLVGLCPFHDDHSPSLWLNPESGLWGCNRPDCSAAGIHDVINFRALFRGISNRAAIKQLADEFL